MELRFPLILDGATGTELQKRGYTGDVCAEQWTLDHPEAIIDIQRGYVAAGSQVVYTPTFGANRRKLEESGLFNCTADYNRRLAELSAQAVQGKALRAGDMSPPARSSPRWATCPSRSWWTSTPSRPPVWNAPAWTCSSSRP